MVDFGMRILVLFNEILADARVKSADADEIHFVDEIKSTHPASSRISSP